MDRALEQAVRILPQRLREAVRLGLRDAEELHLRAQRPLMAAQADGREQPLLRGGAPVMVTEEELRLTLEMATRASYHTAQSRLRAGFLSLPGGHRLGVAGSVTLREGRVWGIQTLSSLCLRVAHPVRGMADALAEQLFKPAPRSSLLLSPPGGGKTTLLRELLRLASDRYGLRPCVADERGEVAGLWRGVPQFDIGVRTDVLDGCPKAEGLLLLLRSMSPQLLAADEITAPEDVSALSGAANCAVPVLATAHAASVEELRQRALYRRLLEERVFPTAVLIQRAGGQRRYTLTPLDA